MLSEKRARLGDKAKPSRLTPGGFAVSRNSLQTRLFQRDCFLFQLTSAAESGD
jgi:hypothetical protein